jgi:type VI secretion system protein ImpA
MTLAAQAKEEQQFGDTTVPAQEPDWRLVKKMAIELLTRAKDLRIAVHLACALIRTDGLPGLTDGLALLRQLIERHWETVHPMLDPEDDNDPTLRVNTVVSLCDRDTTLRGLRDAPLVNSRMVGRFGLRHIEVANGKAPHQGEEAPPTTNSIDAAFMDCDVEELQQTAGVVATAIEHNEAIETALTDRVGASQAPSLSPLGDLLAEIHGILRVQLARRGIGSPAEQTADADGEASTPGAPARSIEGEINNRQDVLRVMDKICDFYARSEPSSPVPLLIRRAKRLVSMDFMQIVRDLAPDGVTQIETLRGTEDSSG